MGLETSTPPRQVLNTPKIASPKEPTNTPTLDSNRKMSYPKIYSKSIPKFRQKMYGTFLPYKIFTQLGSNLHLSFDINTHGNAYGFSAALL